MFYLWKNQAGAGWQLITKSEDEGYVKAEKDKMVKNDSMKRIWGNTYKITDYDLNENEPH